MFHNVKLHEIQLNDLPKISGSGFCVSSLAEQVKVAPFEILWSNQQICLQIRNMF